MKKIIVAALVAAVSAAALSALDFSGFVEARSGWYWGSDELAPMTQIVEGRVDGKVGDAEAPKAQYHASADLEYDPSTNQTSAKIGEAWVKIFAGPLDLSFGNQIVAWSISDGEYPSDVVNPWDYSLPVDLEKIPSPMGRAIINGNSFSIDLVVQPYWTPGILPGSRWATPSQSALGVLPYNGANDEKPDFTWDNVGYGGHAKASFELLQGLDFGLTFYRGRSSSPTGVVLEYSGMYPSAYHYAFDHSTLIGSDLTLSPGGGLLLKTEWAYTTFADTDILEPEAGKASAEGVSGFEYTIGAAQIEGEYVLDWSKGIAADSFAHKVIGIFNWSANDRTALKLAGSYDFSGDGSVMISPQGSYTIADGLQLSCDMYFFFGDRSTIYGSYSDNDLARVTLKYSF
jgi:hypothetical protein